MDRGLALVNLLGRKVVLKRNQRDRFLKELRFYQASSFAKKPQLISFSGADCIIAIEYLHGPTFRELATNRELTPGIIRAAYQSVEEFIISKSGGLLARSCMMVTLKDHMKRVVTANGHLHITQDQLEPFLWRAYHHLCDEVTEMPAHQTHHDLTLNNVVYSDGKAHIIDFEMADMGFWPADVAYFCSCMASHMISNELRNINLECATQVFKAILPDQLEWLVRVLDLFLSFSVDRSVPVHVSRHKQLQMISSFHG